ncbi:MAG: hypothetical protein N3E46_10190 [Gemmataceae bacterium]|nr:hypothetical protein [Gemmataceae bacterium]
MITQITLSELAIWREEADELDGVSVALPNNVIGICTVMATKAIGRLPLVGIPVLPESHGGTEEPEEKPRRHIY